jgi:hypothetical protein
MVTGAIGVRRKTRTGITMSINPYRASSPSAQTSTKVSSHLVQQCLTTKQQIINELIAGRLKLLEATARFHAVHSESASHLARATGAPVTVAGIETMCRVVIGWVHLTLRNRPEEADRLSNRLERELEGHLDRNLVTAC